MPLPIDLAGDWRRLHADLLVDVQYRAYDPATDAHGDPVGCVGVRGARASAWDGGRNVPGRTWTITGLETIPAVNSQIVDGAEVWLIRSVTSDPASETVHECVCVLG